MPYLFPGAVIALNNLSYDNVAHSCLQMLMKIDCRTKENTSSYQMRSWIFEIYIEEHERYFTPLKNESMNSVRKWKNNHQLMINFEFFCLTTCLRFRWTQGMKTWLNVVLSESKNINSLFLMYYYTYKSLNCDWYFAAILSEELRPCYLLSSCCSYECITSIHW